MYTACHHCKSDPNKHRDYTVFISYIHQINCKFTFAYTLFLRQQVTNLHPIICQYTIGARVPRIIAPARPPIALFFAFSPIYAHRIARCTFMYRYHRKPCTTSTTVLYEFTIPHKRTPSPISCPTSVKHPTPCHRGGILRQPRPNELRALR